jgi:hypothetical protein
LHEYQFRLDGPDARARALVAFLEGHE